MFPRFLQDHLSVDAVLVLPTYEGPEAASLTPVAEIAEESRAAGAELVVGAATYITWTLG